MNASLDNLRFIVARAKKHGHYFAIVKVQKRWPAGVTFGQRVKLGPRLVGKFLGLTPDEKATLVDVYIADIEAFLAGS